MVRTMVLICGVALLCVACGRDEDSANCSTARAVPDSVQGLAAELDGILSRPDSLFITPQESYLVRELVDRQFKSGRAKTLAALLVAEVRQGKPWLEDAAAQFLLRVGDSRALLDDADILRGVTELSSQRAHRPLRRQAIVVLAAKDAELAKAMLLAEYGLVDVAPMTAGEPTIAPALAKLGVAAPAEITSLATARAVLAESGIDMDGVDDPHLLAAADAYNRHLHALAVSERFDELAKLTQPAQAAGVMMVMYGKELQNPTPTLTAPGNWLD